MRLTRQSNYAIRTLVYCAVNEPGLSRVADIAKAYNISELFLFKLIKPLVENGLLATVRGAGRLLRCAGQLHDCRSRQQEALDPRSARPVGA